jgi:glutathione reductase (NADPH)
MLALGRNPNTHGIGLEKAGVQLGKVGEVLVDSYLRSNMPNIWAVGDVTGHAQLTPVAIHEAMCLVETLWKGRPTSPDNKTIATAVFSQPEIGTVGMSEDEACGTHDDLEIFLARFRPMRHMLSGRRERMVIKLVVDAKTRRVLGAHVLGPDAGEMAQLLAIPIKAGLTKDDFDRTMAVHPSAAEELVTMYQSTYRMRNGKQVL